ncbi:hypothetical protein C1645_809501 [Glomus cerebriforme]|uniref:Uncharacterized protein n=1 Tax=Glomus cerebriforme TaxID=658196 RepID=A0A397S8T8_9GLOM|nr:hypothetical protein C1645_809501 [Glomus cerebriforme]
MYSTNDILIIAAIDFGTTYSLLQFGIKEHVITSRILKWTYGTDIVRDWEPEDLLSKKLPNGMEFIDIMTFHNSKNFQILMRKDETRPESLFLNFLAIVRVKVDKSKRNLTNVYYVSK